MTNEQVDRTVVTQEATPATSTDPPPPAAPQEPLRTTSAQQTVRTDSSQRRSTSGPGGSELARRVVVLLFGLIQIVIGARIVLLLLDAREANSLVKGILDVSTLFVAPFNGILNKDFLAQGGSVLDLAAILAFVGWTILELIVIWALAIFRREPA
jgi:hypothetical protein